MILCPTGLNLTNFPSRIEVNIAVTASSLLSMRPLWRKVLRSKATANATTKTPQKTARHSNLTTGEGMTGLEMGGMAEDLDECTSSAEELVIEGGGRML